MRIILHEARLNSPFGVVCSLVTLTAYSRGSIIDNDGVRWDTTFKRGELNKAAPLSFEPDREIIVIDIPDVDPAEFLAANTGREYDTSALNPWVLTSG